MVDESIRYPQLEYELAIRNNNASESVAAIEAITMKFHNIGRTETAEDWITKAASILDRIPDHRLMLIVRMRREPIRAETGDSVVAATNLKALQEQDLSRSTREQPL